MKSQAPPELCQIQREFSQFLSGQPSKIDTFIDCSNNSLLSAQARCAIYQRNYRNALLNSIRDTFVATAALVEPEQFEQFASNFVDSNASTSQDLNSYAARFADWFKNTSSTRNLRARCPYLSDLLSLEWAHFDSSLSAPDQVFDFKKFASLGEDQYSALVFLPSNSLRVITVEFNILSLWRAARLGDRTHATELAHRIGPESTGIALFRSDGISSAFQIDHLTAELISLFKQRRTLNDIEKELLNRSESSGVDNISEHVITMISNKWVQSFEL